MHFEPHTFIFLLFAVPMILMVLFRKRTFGRFTIKKAVVIAILGLVFFTLDLVIHNVPELQSTLHTL